MAETSTAAAVAIPKSVTLISSDGKHFTVAEEAALQSTTIKNIVDDGCSDGPIPLPNVNSEILSQVIVYLKTIAGDGGGEEFLEKEMEEEELIELLLDYLMAANYHDIRSLRELISKKIADLIKEKSPEEMRKVFGIVNDYTPEEEEKIRNDISWAFDDNQ